MLRGVREECSNGIASSSSFHKDHIINRPRTTVPYHSSLQSTACGPDRDSLLAQKLAGWAGKESKKRQWAKRERRKEKSELQLEQKLSIFHLFRATEASWKRVQDKVNSRHVYAARERERERERGKRGWARGRGSWHVVKSFCQLLLLLLFLQFVICVVQLIAEINLSNATLPHCGIVVALLLLCLLSCTSSSASASSSSRWSIHWNRMCLWIGELGLSLAFCLGA